MSTQPVEYRDVKGFPGYRVGDDGSVWCSRPRNGKGQGRAEWRRLNPRPNGPSGHLRVQLAAPGGGYIDRYVHRLVLEAFVGPCPAGMECRHFPDRDPTNNRIGNLSWATHAENMADMIAHDTTSRGEKSPMAKLTDSLVRQIRADPRTIESIAADVGVSTSVISRVISGKRWSHVRTA